MVEEERCPLTELIVSQCACAKHRPDLIRVNLNSEESPTNDVMISRPFILDFDGLSFHTNECGCGRLLYDGDEVCYVDGEFTCMECVAKLKRAETRKFTRKWKSKVVDDE